MGKKTGIQWTKATWNPTWGCTRVSEGCRHCYAEGEAARTAAGHPDSHGGFLDAKGRWNGRVAIMGNKLGDPLRWSKPTEVFTNSMSDVGHEGYSDAEILGLWGIMACAPIHTFQVLTKRPKRLVEVFKRAAGGTDVHARDNMVLRVACYEAAVALISAKAPAKDCALLLGRLMAAQASVKPDACWPPPNIHVGVSTEDQATATARIPLLFQIPNALAWISAEPLIGPIDLRGLGDGSWFDREGADLYDALHGTAYWSSGAEHGKSGGPRLAWVVVGGESGQGARACAVPWIKKVVDDCRGAGVPVFVKQLGAVATVDDRDNPRLMLRHKNGGDPSEWGGLGVYVRQIPKRAEGGGWMDLLDDASVPAAQEGAEA
jgi:protein gp37